LSLSLQTVREIEEEEDAKRQLKKKAAVARSRSKESGISDLQKEAGGDGDSDELINPEVLFTKARRIGGKLIMLKLSAKREEHGGRDCDHGKLLLTVDSAADLASEGMVSKRGITNALW
jgi:hypothetical protein